MYMKRTLILCLSCFLPIFLGAQTNALVKDLISKMTLEEKIAQMQNSTPAIPRLGIPAYDWWNECLHGVARSGDKVTVFPQAIGMAATFDEDALRKVGEIIATEARAVYNESLRNGTAGRRYKGLTFWTPNINIYRDPRWGRGQETYGEDPYLTGLLGKAFVLGLQGEDQEHMKASACAKHYAVHSGPEPSRHSFDVDVSEYDLWDTYLPAFRDLIVDAKVSGVMGAYNRFRGEPCCAHDYLSTTILRDWWAFDGYVTSDCGAIWDFYANHKTHASHAAAIADAIKHDTDLDCGSLRADLARALDSGLLSEADLDAALSRLLTIRFRLGLLDSGGEDPYAGIPYSVLECEEHKEHALRMARESVVLLENKGILPLSGEIRNILVLGPNADDTAAPLGNYNGFPSELITPLKGLLAEPGIRVSYYKACDYLSPLPDEDGFQDALRRADLVLFVGGISPELEGEEGGSGAGANTLEGFYRGDRTTILLPAVQTALMKRVKAAGKPLVFACMSGGAVAFPWEKENADAILQLWYGGQSIGKALCDILWGRYNPSGKLPLTFYADDSQLPEFTDYSMAGRTYRYFEGTPAYPFGYGLSYTTFSYSKLKASVRRPRAGRPLKVSVRVRNTGSAAGEDVIQLYVSHPEAPAPKPIRALKGVRRVHLQPGQERIVSFTLSPRDLSLVAASGVSICRPGTVQIRIGDQVTEVRVRGAAVELPR